MLGFIADSCILFIGADEDVVESSPISGSNDCLVVDCGGLFELVVVSELVPPAAMKLNPDDTGADVVAKF